MQAKANTFTKITKIINVNVNVNIKIIVKGNNNFSPKTSVKSQGNSDVAIGLQFGNTGNIQNAQE